MKLVIDIEQELYERSCKVTMSLDGALPIYQSIKEGTPYEERPHGEWIPCSERLPEEDEDIIITHLGYMKKPIVDVSYFDGDFRSEDGEAYFSEVIAWMPLPEPYQKEGEAE